MQAGGVGSPSPHSSSSSSSSSPSSSAHRLGCILAASSSTWSMRVFSRPLLKTHFALSTVRLFAATLWGRWTTGRGNSSNSCIRGATSNSSSSSSSGRHHRPNFHDHDSRHCGGGGNGRRRRCRHQQQLAAGLKRKRASSSSSAAAATEDNSSALARCDSWPWPIRYHRRVGIDNAAAAAAASQARTPLGRPRRYGDVESVIRPPLLLSIEFSGRRLLKTTSSSSSSNSSCVTTTGCVTADSSVSRVEENSASADSTSGQHCAAKLSSLADSSNNSNSNNNSSSSSFNCHSSSTLSCSTGRSDTDHCLPQHGNVTTEVPDSERSSTLLRTQSELSLAVDSKRASGIKAASGTLMEQPAMNELFADVESKCRLQVTNGSHPIVEAAFEKLVNALTDISDPRLADFAEWFRKVIEYNVPEGKRTRLVAVMLAYQSLEKCDMMTADKLETAALLGWCVELLQAFFLICDDIMDNSLTRRGKKCWYQVEGVHMMAVNDSVLCETAIYRVLKTFFRNHPNYVDLLELFHDVTFQTASGQCLDMLSERQGGGYVEKRYNAIVLYKTAFYSFSLPIRLGMYLAGISDQASHRKAEALALRIGHIFQIQDDFLDCYGSPEVIGKVGTDIVDAKCSWMIVTALQLATLSQKRELLDHYGKGSPGGPEESVVKQLYDDLCMPMVFRETEDRAFADIKDDIMELELAQDNEVVLNTDIFKLLANKIYRRNK